MSDDAAEFTVSLQDKISGGAKSAEKSLGALDKKLQGTGAASDGAGKAMGLMGGAAGLAVGAFVTVSAAIGDAVFKMGELSVKASEAQEAAYALAEAEYGSAKAAKAVVDAQYAVSAASALSQDAVFGMAQKLERAGVSADQFKDTLKAMTDTAAVAGDQATKPIEKVLKKVEQLGTFKIKDTDLKGSGIKYAEVIDQIAQDTGKSVDQIKTAMASGQIAANDGVKAMNEVLERKFGAAAAGKALGIDAQISKAKENFVNLFKDVDTSPAKKGLHELFSLLDQNTATGKALKNVLTGAMNGLFKAAAASIPYVEAFLLNVGIAALDVYISMKPAIAAIKKALGSNDKGTENNMKAVATAGKVVGFVIAAMVTGMAAIWAAGAFAFKGILLGINAVSSGWHKMVAGVKSVYTSIKTGLGKAVDYVKGLPDDFSAAGDAMIDGLVQAITGGAAKVVSAVTGVMSGAIKAGKDAIGMKSPAKKFGEMGDASVTGYVQRVDKGHAKVQASVKNLLTFPRSVPSNDNARGLVAQRPIPVSSGSTVGGARIEAGAVVIHVHAQPGQDAKSIAAEVRREFLTHVEELATGTGGR